MDLKDKIRIVMDFPKKGIAFSDITTLLKEKAAFVKMIDEMKKKYQNKEIDLIVGAEARGFIIGAALAYAMNVGFVPVRKPGKLPAETISESYDLEYGQDTICMHKDAIKEGQRVLLVDDLLATGGTIGAVVKLVEKLGGKVMGMAFVIELLEFNARKNFEQYDVYSLLKY